MEKELSKCKLELETANSKIDHLHSSLEFYEAVESAKNV